MDDINKKCRDCRVTDSRPFGAAPEEVCEECGRCLYGHCSCDAEYANDD